VLWQWTGDKFMPPGIWSVANLRRKPIDISCYRGMIQSKDFFNHEGEEMTPILYYPLDRGFRVSQVFGVNPPSYQVSGGHNGIDWAVPVGNKIYAAQPGYVSRVETTTVGYGRHIRIQSADGITIYGHLSRIDVVQGAYVQAMQPIGLSGGALTDPYRGYSSGPHLHFEYRPNAIPTTKQPGTLAGAIDPMPYLKDHPTTQQVPVLFQAKCLVASLRVRSTADLTSTTNIIGGIGYNDIRNVYEEKNGCYRIDPYISIWCSAGSQYMLKIASSTPEPTPPVETLTVLNWSKSATTWMNSSGYLGDAPDKY
jgi:hypothetical protein